MDAIKKLLQCCDGVMMDAAHIWLIRALVACLKPMDILEIGVGSGAGTDAILQAATYNGNGARVTCVDNFLDWGGAAPSGIESIPVKLIVKSERDFIDSCQAKFDFIVSDADHDHSHEWIAKTMGLLNHGGVAVFHDVSNSDYPNLEAIISFMRWAEHPHFVFKASSRPDERCERGLLVVFKA